MSDVPSLNWLEETAFFFFCLDHKPRSHLDQSLIIWIVHCLYAPDRLHLYITLQ